MKDKISKGDGGVSEVLLVSDRNAVAEEAAAALQMLGFSKQNISKAIQKIVSSNPNIKVEELIKQALQIL